MKNRILSGSTLGENLLWLIMIGSLAFMMGDKATQMPPLFFDEGCNFNVAKNWVEHGVYGRFLDGQPVSAHQISSPFPITGFIALSFKFFGVGVFQGRLPFIFFTIGNLILLRCMATRLFNRRIGNATLVIALILSTSDNLLISGRYALAEMPMVFFLLLGYWLLSHSLQGKNYLLPAVAFCWGTALATQLQPLPFFILSLTAISMDAWRRKEHRTLWMAIFSLAGALSVFLGYRIFQIYLERGLSYYTGPVHGLLQSAAFVLDKDIRWSTLVTFLYLGLPVTLGLAYSLRRWFLQREMPPSISYPSLGLLTFCISWLAWFVSLSVGWPRYYFPIGVIGSIFLAALLDAWTAHFKFRAFVAQVGGPLRKLKLSKASAAGILAIFIFSNGLIFNYYFLRHAFLSASDGAFQTARFLAEKTPMDALVEGFDSEIQFLVDRRFHFPPDQAQVDMNLRAFTPISFTYDPLEANPDYLVVGPMTRYWKLYDPVISSGKLQRVFSAPGYDIYKTDRP